MKEENKIADKAPLSDGLTVPEGYFADFSRQMAASLPYRAELEDPLTHQLVAPRTPWQRIRPYAYMAAMFAGVWCMLKMFTIMSATPTEINFSNDPELARAGKDVETVNTLIIDNLSDYDIYESYLEGDIVLDDSLYLPPLEIPDDVPYILPEK